MTSRMLTPRVFVLFIFPDFPAKNDWLSHIMSRLLSPHWSCEYTILGSIIVLVSRAFFFIFLIYYSSSNIALSSCTFSSSIIQSVICCIVNTRKTLETYWRIISYHTIIWNRCYGLQTQSNSVLWNSGHIVSCGDIVDWGTSVNGRLF